MNKLTFSKEQKTMITKVLARMLFAATKEKVSEQAAMESVEDIMGTCTNFIEHLDEAVDKHNADQFPSVMPAITGTINLDTEGLSLEQVADKIRATIEEVHKKVHSEPKAEKEEKKVVNKKKKSPETPDTPNDDNKGGGINFNKKIIE